MGFWFGSWWFDLRTWVMRAGTHFSFHAHVHNESWAYQMGQNDKVNVRYLNPSATTLKPVMGPVIHVTAPCPWPFITCLRLCVTVLQGVSPLPCTPSNIPIYGDLCFFSVHPLTQAAILKTPDAGTLDIRIITLEQIHPTRPEWSPANIQLANTAGHPKVRY